MAGTIASCSSRTGSLTGASLAEGPRRGWEYDVEVVVDAPLDVVARRLPRALGRLEPIVGETTRLVGSTSNPWWYAEQLVRLPAAFRIVRCAELQEAAQQLGRRLLGATRATDSEPPVE